MLDKFSFQYHYLERILCFHDYLFPGIVRIDIIFYNEKDGTINAKTKTRETKEPDGNILDIAAVKADVEKFRSQKAGIYWFDNNTIPWHVKAYDNNKADLFTDLNVLMLSLESSSVNNDLIIFYFKKFQTNISSKSETIKYNDVERDLIGSAYLYFLKTLKAIGNDDFKLWNFFSGGYTNLGNEIDNLRKKANHEVSRFDESYITTSRLHLDDAEKVHNKKYAFSNGSINRIKAFRGNHYYLKEIVEKAVKVANITSGENNNETIIIHEHFLDFTITTQEAGVHNFKYNGVFDYLNRMDAAIKILKDSNKRITGEQVGATMVDPVSSSAITQFVKNNWKGMNRLFELYPDKWELVKTEFSTVLKRMPKNVNSDKMKILTDQKK